MVVEIVGPLIEDRGILTASVGKVLSGAGLELRPGALDQMAGADLGWAVSTALEGHGRDDLAGSTPELVRRVIDLWRHSVNSGQLTLAPGAAESWRALLQSGRAVFLLSPLPAPLVGELGSKLRLAALEQMLVRNSERFMGAPKPDSLRAAMASQSADPTQTLAAVSSPSAIMASVAAGCNEVIQVGLPTGIGESMPVDRFVGRIDELFP